MTSSSSSSLHTRRTPSPLPLPLLLTLTLLSLTPLHTTAYSWRFKEVPKQCGTVTIDITGTDGQPPYRALVIPDGPNPLSGNEVRKLMDVPFDANATSVSFKLKYPANGRLVTVISDASGFGTGGASVSASVADSDDDSCFDSSEANSPLFVFDIQPRGQLTQCVDTRFYTPSPDTVQGDPVYHGVIPGGNAFTIPQGPITTENMFGRGFTWKCNLRTGTQLLVVAGDNRGIHTGGSINLVIANPSNGDASCLDASSPSSTPGTPAGGSYPTGTGGSGGNSDGSGTGGGSNTGAIVGGVVGGLVALSAAFLLIFFYRRRKKQMTRRAHEKPIDLNEGDDEGGEGDESSHDRLSRNNLPEFYRPEPFTVPDPTIASTYGGYTDAGDDSNRPLSGTATSFYTRSGTPDGSVALGYGVGNAPPSSNATGRKGQPPRMRPVNIIQHDDAGPSAPSYPPGAEEEEPETVELPPAYTAIKAPPAPAGDSSTSATAAVPPAK